MADDLVFDTSFPVQPDACEELTPLVRRIVADNPGPFTLKGTCTYIIGRGAVAVLDPGPERPEHVDAILNAVRGETVTHIVVTHTHRDHSPSSRALRDATGAPIVGCSPHRHARPLFPGETDRLSADMAHVPDRELFDGDVVEGDGWTLAAVETPGHTANHLAFALREEKALFSGDHVMAWSTTVVSPPDGSMTQYMASLEKLQARSETIYWPGHGGPVREPQRFLRGLIHHRRQREISILNRLEVGDRTIDQIVAAIYQGINPALVRPAGLSVLAHLEDLAQRGMIAMDGPPSLETHFRPA